MVRSQSRGERRGLPCGGEVELSRWGAPLLREGGSRGRGGKCPRPDPAIWGLKD